MFTTQTKYKNLPVCIFILVKIQALLLHTGMVVIGLCGNKSELCIFRVCSSE